MKWVNGYWNMTKLYNQMIWENKRIEKLIRKQKYCYTGHQVGNWEEYVTRINVCIDCLDTDLHCSQDFQHTSDRNHLLIGFQTNQIH